MGGGFGSKNGPREHTYVAAELAKRTGRAVRCFNNRREENLDAGNRNATIQRLVAGARADGTLTALGGEFVNAVGFRGFSASTSGPMQMLYGCPNVRTTEYGAKLNTPPNAAFRAPGFVEGTFGLDCSTSSRQSSTSIRSSCGGRTTPTPTSSAAGRSRRRTCSSVTAGPSLTGSAAMKCGRIRRDRGNAVSASPARSGTAAVGRPRTRGCASARTGA
jgi:hypothetical protein